ncbi:hypothetical protein NGM37_27730, partial [Streptomyces sp. TRM76130]|nr:hypothetical protein [Streptomyces sp. TRM76130]
MGPHFVTTAPVRLVPAGTGAAGRSGLLVGARYRETALAADRPERYTYQVDATNTPGHGRRPRRAGG